EDLELQGILEHLLVKEIADCNWRLRRVQRTEVAEISKQFKRSEFDDLDFYQAKWTLHERARSLPVAIESMRQISAELSNPAGGLVFAWNSAVGKIFSLGYTAFFPQKHLQDWPG